jgi:hypothetical protein
MSKVLLITDQHFGVRNDNQYYLERYRLFYENVVLPYIDEHGITEIINLGDTFDRRKYVNFNSLDYTHDMWFKPVADRGIRMTCLVGNHDIYYKNTLKVSSPDLLLTQYQNINVVSTPTEMTIGGKKMMLVPWICDENREETLDMINKSKAQFCMGHLELNGFSPVPGYTMEHGDNPDIFKKFKLTCSGHYHMRSRRDRIQYLGNPYQLYWNDYGHERGFHILNTTDANLEFIKNPYNTFSKLFYKDGVGITDEEIDSVKGTYVKLVVEDKTDQLAFDQTVRRLHKADLADLKIIEDMSYDLDEDIDVEVEDTLTILESCVSEFDNGHEIFGILKSLYLEAQEV